MFSSFIKFKSPFVIFLGSCLISVLTKSKNIASFILLFFKSLLKKPFYAEVFLQQLIFIGFLSLPVIGLTALFSGAVLALQTFSGFSRFSAESTIPTVVVLSIVRELGPVLSGLMVSGRVGSSIAAEIATMKVTDQIDALYILSTNPTKYLIIPKVLATTISLPLLVIVADFIGIMGGYLVSIYKFGFNNISYIENTFKYLKAIDIYMSLTKAAFFGFTISLTACFFGYNADKGARGVGVATTNSVVMSSILLLLSNYFITQLFI